jgi:hypothetical protein
MEHPRKALPEALKSMAKAMQKRLCKAKTPFTLLIYEHFRGMEGFQRNPRIISNQRDKCCQGSKFRPIQACS